jgi:hypothetical protein
LAIWQKINKQKARGCQRCEERAQHHPPQHDPATCSTCQAQQLNAVAQEPTHPLNTHY